MDEADRADRAIEEHRQAALAMALRPMAMGQPRRDHQGVVRCAECDEPIPLARLRLLPNAARCQECQAIAEHRYRLGQGPRQAVR